MERDQHPVGGDLHVGLDVAVAETDGVLERRHRVLRGVARPAAVGERDRALPLEERMGGRRHGLSCSAALASPAMADSTNPGSSGAASASTIVVRSPYDGSVIGEIPAQTAADVDRAVATAKAALERGVMPLWQRAQILDLAAQRLAARRDEFAEIIAKEAAKPIKTARVEAERAVGTFQFAAAEARKLAGDVIPLDAISAGEGKIGFTLRVPIGVVGAIAPFNFPLNLVAHKVGAGHRRRLPRGAQAGEPDPVQLDPPGARC